MNTIDGSFRESVRSFPDRVALRYYQDEMWEHITYAELKNAVNITAYGLSDVGINRDSKVAIMSENRPEWIVSYLAIITSGAIAIPIDAQLGETETNYILNHSGVETIFCSMRCYEIISRIISDLKSLKNIIILDRNITIRHDHRGYGDGRDLANNGRKTNRHKIFLSYDELRDRGINQLEQGDFTLPEKTINDLASIIYTSGTTGTAKGVMLTHKNFMSNAEAAIDLIKIDQNDNFLLLLPLHHVLPFTDNMVAPLVTGAAMSFVDILSRDRTRLIMECQPTIMIGVPLLYSKIYKGIIRQIEASTFKTLLFKYGGKKIIGEGLKKKTGWKVENYGFGRGADGAINYRWICEFGYWFY